MFSQKKVNILAGVAALLAIFAVFYSIHENRLDSTQTVTVGSLVKVKHGYYEGCKGTVLNEVYTNPVTDRQGNLHPSIFAGYSVDLVCNNEHTGDRFFSPDFLRVVRK